MSKIILQEVFMKVRKERQEYFGNRYFRYSYDSQTVVQVCVSVGETVKKGKANNIGIYVIHKMTLFGNYLAMNYTEPCSKKEYETKFNEVVKMLLLYIFKLTNSCWQSIENFNPFLFPGIGVNVQPCTSCPAFLQHQLSCCYCCHLCLTKGFFIH